MSAEAFALGTFFWWEKFFVRGLADLRPLFKWMPLLLIVLVSALSMRLWADERRVGTLEVLLTLPVPRWQLVVGKFLAGMVLIVSSGFLVPLQFIGGALGTLCRASPFAALAQQPIEVFLEIRPAWRAWLPQLAWLAALEVALRGALGGATRKLVVQGG